ncbi:SDR family NAD(P)-dependent oxidoreductase [Chthonobacter rhizosphaerae]|uniref:SDR family NAD(P)-dependent oxidoreductase n=1 Tax=Chthonobacter rhizosphaerae TaxID=2735553 RepID=UPI0015EECB09|nr:SDR family NAD(P)-dependent oxidoreductase [Chthonobacter rhizosphaerae]
MATHPAFTTDGVAVVTGAASGIGRAAAERFAGLGLKVALADVNEPMLEEARAAVAALAGGDDRVIAVPTDVSDRAALVALRDAVEARLGPATVLMPNAGREGGGGLFADPIRWTETIGTNLFGVVNAIQAFVPGMMERGEPGAVIVTGSKQGITTPPGDTAYNVSKAGVKVVTEALAHDLRSREGCRVTAHLLIPGFTFTGFTRVRTSVKPDAAWTPEQVIDFMMEAVDRGDFYILCPDNDVTRPMDEKRMRWAMDDVIENRPALSRWHPDYADAFAAWMKG